VLHPVAVGVGDDEPAGTCTVNATTAEPFGASRTLERSSVVSGPASNT
jgi:hypothetical protein